MATLSKPRFVFPAIHENPTGWGPCEVPEQFKDTPYQPFSKADRLGKVYRVAADLEILVIITIWICYRWLTGPAVYTKIGVQQVRSNYQ